MQLQVFFLIWMTTCSPVSALDFCCSPWIPCSVPVATWSALDTYDTSDVGVESVEVVLQYLGISILDTHPFWHMGMGGKKFDIDIHVWFRCRPKLCERLLESQSLMIAQLRLAQQRS